MEDLLVWKYLRTNGLGSLLLLIQVPGCLGPPHLGILAGLLCTHRAGHQHLGLYRLPSLEMSGDNVSQALDEGWITVWSSTAADTFCSNLCKMLKKW